MYDPRTWRALARGPEYIPPHTSVHHGPPLRPLPHHVHVPHPVVDTQPPLAATTTVPSSHVQGPPSPTAANAKLSRPPGFASSPKSPKFGRQKPHLVFPLDARPARASKTLTKLLDKLEDDQKRDIHMRIAGHLNHDKVFEGLVKASQEQGDEGGGGSSSSSSHRRGRRGRPNPTDKDPDTLPPGIIQIPVARSFQDSIESPRTPPPAAQRPTSRRSKQRQDQAALLASSPEGAAAAGANQVLSAVIHKKARNPDRASILYHQYLDEAQVEPTPLGKLHVASRYFDVLIQDFRLFAPLLSGIKTAYHDVVEQYITDLNELEALKRGLLVSIARHQAKAGVHDQLMEQVTQLQHEKDELAAQVRTLEQMMHARDAHAGSRAGTLGHHALGHSALHGPPAVAAAAAVTHPPPPGTLHPPGPAAPATPTRSRAGSVTAASVVMAAAPPRAASPGAAKSGASHLATVTLPEAEVGLEDAAADAPASRLDHSSTVDAGDGHDEAKQDELDGKSDGVVTRGASGDGGSGGAEGTPNGGFGEEEGASGRVDG